MSVKGTKSFMVFAIVCNRPLNKLFLAVLANEIGKYESRDTGKHAMVVFVHPAQGDEGCTLDSSREKFSIRDLRGEYAKLASSALRAEIVRCSEMTTDGEAKKKLGCEAAHAFVVHARSGERILDTTVDIITSLFGHIEKGKESSPVEPSGDGGAAPYAANGAVSEQIYNAMKKTFITSIDESIQHSYQMKGVAEAYISYRILSTGPVALSEDTKTYADAFRRDLTVYDISGNMETQEGLRELKTQIQTAEEEYLKNGDLGAFTKLDEYMFISSAGPDRQSQFFTNFLGSYPMGDGFSTQLFRLLSGV